MNLPDPPRFQRLLFCSISMDGSATYLNVRVPPMQKRATVARIGQALPSVAEMWTFHPCGGGMASGGLQFIHNPLRALSHVEGSMRSTTREYVVSPVFSRSSGS